MFTRSTCPGHSIRRVAILLCTLLAVSACTDATTSGARQALSVSLTTQAQGAAADLVVSVGSASLVLTKAQLVARRIELAPVNASGCAASAESGDDDTEEADGCAEVEVGPTILDLPLDGSTQTNITASVPAGTYRALEVRIRPVSGGNRQAAAFLAAHPELKDVSVRIDGTYNGKPFVFMSALDARIETTFSTPITVGAGNQNVTVALDIRNWFSDGAGGTLDPSDGSNVSRISANIAASFRAFQDDDRDGHDDQHR